MKTTSYTEFYTIEEVERLNEFVSSLIDDCIGKIDYTKFSFDMESFYDDLKQHSEKIELVNPCYGYGYYDWHTYPLIYASIS